jgi:hypothetical protein
MKYLKEYSKLKTGLVYSLIELKLLNKSLKNKYADKLTVIKFTKEVYHCGFIYDTFIIDDRTVPDKSKKIDYYVEFNLNNALADDINDYPDDYIMSLNLGKDTLFTNVRMEDSNLADKFNFGLQDSSLLEGYLPMMNDIIHILVNIQDFIIVHGLERKLISNFEDFLVDKTKTKEWEEYWIKKIKENPYSYRYLQHGVVQDVDISKLEELTRHLNAEHGFFDM